MLNAPVGDDVFNEDPSINLLQERAAEYFGHEAALYCPSGTMTNQIAIQVHTRPGDEVICSSKAHIYLYEGGGIGKNAGCSVRLISGDKGRFKANQALREINPPDDHYPRTSLVAIEDTCNKGGGSCYELSEIRELSKFSKENGLSFHLDGARVFNALVARGHDPKEYGKLFDSLSICMSKGLGAPVGSLLLGDAGFIKEAHRIRKSMGGGMRQAGVVAAAALYALENNVDRLEEDHRHATILAEALEDCSSVESVTSPETNIVIFKLQQNIHSKDFTEKLKSEGILSIPFGPEMVRFVTHKDVDAGQIQKAANTLCSI